MTKLRMFHATIAALACALLLAAGCGKQTTVLQIQSNGRGFLNPQKGEIVKWTTPDGGSVKVTFRGKASPCEEGVSTSTCTVANDGVYLYKCDGCSDANAGLIVGPNTGSLERPRGQAPVVSGETAVVYCEGSKTKVDPDPLSIASSTGGGVSRVQWFLAGNTTDRKFTVNLAAGTCSEPSIDQDHNVCTLLPEASKNQAYQVSAACGGNGSADLLIR
jgi:hypothetical protein